jgi:quercetin dioxygenase-like cupin family protein
MDDPVLRTKLVPPGTAEELPLGPSHVRVLIGGSDTAERVVLVEEHLPPGPGSPPTHLHRGMDHTFYVTGGVVRFTAGDDDDIEIAAGGALFVPRGVPHTFQNASESEDASFLEFDSPGHFDSYFRELSALLLDEGFVVDRIRELQARYDTEPPT